MIVTFDKPSHETCLPLVGTKLFGIRKLDETGIPEYYEFVFEMVNGVVMARNTQFRLVLDPEHPNYHGLVEAGRAMDVSRFANGRAKALIEAMETSRFGPWVPPTFYAITNTTPEIDQLAVKALAEDVLGNSVVIEKMRSNESGTTEVREEGNFTTILVTDESGNKKGYRLAIPAAELNVVSEAYFGEPLFSFSAKAGLASRRWIADKIVNGVEREVNGSRKGWNIGLIKTVPTGSEIWIDARSCSRYFNMPSRWSSRHVQFEGRSPFRTTAFRAAGITVGK